MKNTMLLSITILLCAAQPIYSIKDTKKTKQTIKKITFDKAGFLESNEPIDKFTDKKIIQKLKAIQVFYEKIHNQTVPNIGLNAIGHTMLQFPLNTITTTKNVITITYENGTVNSKHKTKTYKILTPDKQNP